MNSMSFFPTGPFARSSRGRSEDRSRSRSRSGSRGRSRASAITNTSTSFLSSSPPPAKNRPSIITTDLSTLTAPPSTMPVIRETTERSILDSPVSPLSPYSMRTCSSSSSGSNEDDAKDLTDGLMRMSTDGSGMTMMPIITVTDIHGKTSTHTCFFVNGNKGGDFHMICEGCEELS